MRDMTVIAGSFANVIRYGFGSCVKDIAGFMSALGLGVIAENAGCIDNVSVFYVVNQHVVINSEFLKRN